MSNKSKDDRSLSRRGLLRRGATVTAATAGAAVVGAAVLPGAAQAAPGDDLQMGTTNTATPQTTTLTTQTATASLTLANSEGAPLRLVPAPTDALYGTPPVPEIAGTVSVDEWEDIYLPYRSTIDPNQGTYASWAWTTAWATTSVAVPPTRVVDTRDPALRGNIIAGLENLDSAGRMKAGTAIVISLDPYVKAGWAMKGNVTVTGTTSSGFVTVWGVGSRPVASSLNWWSAGQILSNFVFAELGMVDTFSSVVAIYAAAPAQVILDLTSLVVSHPNQVRIGGAANAAQLPTLTTKRGSAGAPKISN
ncbi:hypothetical protein GCM10027280_48110 [Micromonospora polyrhachis]|uniref:Uncharacterized protein n=1 Tax=Micromonospora polyrhachis TaxID=1282883 RepID=A0A7W7WRU2_9ACTN|nr:hypothetical protein [Micromonospora polyrhachis]MBB4960663.1 hypothetical protein [Micromonospora polyrhachis]